MNRQLILARYYFFSEVEKASIKKGIAQLDRGEGIPHKEVIAKYRKKYDV